MSTHRVELTDGAVSVGLLVCAEQSQWRLVIDRADGTTIGELVLRQEHDTAVLLGGWTQLPAGVVRTVLGWALTHPGGPQLPRVEVQLSPDDDHALTLAARAGLRREGIRREVSPQRIDRVILARLADDPPITSPHGFRAVVNASLPRQRVIAQVLLRDEQGRVLMCGLTYKPDWDLPGGVTEQAESPRLAAEREIREELGLHIVPGDLLLVDWLPPWGGWDAAVCLIFDGGRHSSSLTERITPDQKEIHQVEWLDHDQVHARAADFTARRVAAALAALDQSGPRFTESGQPPRR